MRGDAYGHGAMELSRSLSNPDGFAVDFSEEATALSDGGIERPMFVLEGSPEKSDLLPISARGFRPVICSDYQLGWIERTDLDSPIDILLGFDAVMSRLGFELNGVAEIVDRARLSKHVNSITLVTNFARADELRCGLVHVSCYIV